MATTKSRRTSHFICNECGTVAPKWTGRCDGCGEWNTVVEEIILPGSTQEQAAEVAERVRYSIETQAGAAVRDIPGLRITSSFGVASIKLGAKDAPELIDQADNALYESKKSGRNRVSVWSGARSVGAEAEAEA